MIISDCINYYSSGSLCQRSPHVSGETLLKELCATPEGADLVREAEEKLHASNLLKLDIRIEKTTNGFLAENLRNIIRVNTGNSRELQLFLLIFELTNTIQNKEHKKVSTNALLGIYRTAEEFAKAREYIEYKGLLRACEITAIINKKLGSSFRKYIDTPWEKYDIKRIGFDQYYSTCLSEPHKEYYRKLWRKVNNTSNTRNQSTVRNRASI